MKLIYHKLGKNNESPFLNELLKLFKDSDVSMTCPYIDRKYLTILHDAANEVRIISDITEWLNSCSNTYERKKTLELIKDFGDKIHHCDNLHSKVFLNKERAILGSANLTVSGMRKNIEMSISIDDLKLIEELNFWFDDMWDKTKMIDSSDLIKLEKRIDNEGTIKATFERRKIGLSDGSPIIMAGNPDEFKRIPNTSRDIPSEILEIAEFFPSRKWLAEFFDIWTYIIGYFKLKEDDQRVTLSIRNTRDRFSMIIGQRYVVTAYCNGIISLIMPLESKISNEDKPLYRQEVFTKMGEKDNYLNYFKTDSPKKVFSHYKDDVITCIKNELDRTTVSGYKRHHRKELYLISTEEERRENLLNKAFRTIN